GARTGSSEERACDELALLLNNEARFGTCPSRFPHCPKLGFSLGGHTVLKCATEVMDPRVRAVSVVCPPLDLAAGQQAVDRFGATIYRPYVMGHVKEIYREVAAKREVPIPVAEAERIQTLWDWDETIISARYGFAGAADYYARCRAVYFGPRNEDFGFVTIEAFRSRKCVITCRDSGGPLDLVQDGVSGFIT
ncbi:MAG: glycosyltransferase, partial [bacterium]|nr:glycosyltransferase [bacterium]